MRFQAFIRRIIGTEQTERVTFGPDHFKEAGVNYGSLAGMPLLEAHQLVNKWNGRATNFVYWLEA